VVEDLAVADTAVADTAVADTAAEDTVAEDTAVADTAEVGEDLRPHRRSIAAARLHLCPRLCHFRTECARPPLGR
jgi:hypothetical protein